MTIEAVDARRVTLEVTFRPIEQDLADGSLWFGDEHTLTIQADLDHPRELASQRIHGVDDAGRDIVVFPGGKKVRARAPDQEEGAYKQSLGRLTGLEEVLE